MATKKMEGRVETMEEQIVGVHEEMKAVKGELQKLGPLEVKVDSMLEKLSLIDKMEKVLWRWENSERASSSEEKKDKNTSPKDPDLTVLAATTGESSLGGRTLPREELRMESRPNDMSRQSRTSSTYREARIGEGSKVKILT